MPPQKHESQLRRVSGAAGVLCVVALTALAGGNPASADETETPPTDPHLLPEDVRKQISDLVVLPGSNPTDKELSGTYDKASLGAIGGMAAGSRVGSRSVDVGPVTVNTSIPVLIFPGAVAGTLFGDMQRRVQDFRDELADELAGASGQPLDNSRLARQVFQDLQTLPYPESRLFAASTPVPGSVDTFLYVTLRDVAIDVQKSDAILKTTAEIALHRASDNERLYRKWLFYQDQDSLSNWTKDDNALWRDYANFAAHFLGRKISEAVLARADVGQTIQPARSRSISFNRRDPWDAKTRSTTPTLAWDYEIKRPADQSGANVVDTDSVRFDVELYDRHRPVFEQRGVAGSSFSIPTGLEPCKTYWWTVRPVYAFGETIRYGGWMRKPVEDDATTPNGINGRKASDTPAYIQDFATLTVSCRASASKD